MQRNKGKRFEREVASEFRERGFEAARSIQSRGAEGGDVLVRIQHPLFSALWLECKHQAQPNVRAALEQAAGDELASRSADTGFRAPLAVTKQNRGEAVVSMSLDTFLELARALVPAVEGEQ